MSPASTFSPPRVAPNLTHAWGGIWRLTFRRLLLPSHWLTLAVGLAVLTLLFTGGPRAGGAGQFLDWTASFYVTFLVPAVAFMAAGGAMREEMKSGNVDYVLTRPVPRPAFVVFKFIAHTLCLQLDFLIAFVLVMFFAASRQVPDLAAVGATLLYTQLLMITAFSAFGFLCGAIAARYIVIGLAYAGIIEAGVGQIPTQISRLSMTHQVRDLLAVLFHRVEPVATSPSLLGTTLIVLAFTAVMLTAAATIFTLRELSGHADV